MRDGLVQKAKGPLFAHYDGQSVRPLLKPHFLKLLRQLLPEHEDTVRYGHAFRMGGASHL
jgi:hypothetical protein